MTLIERAERVLEYWLNYKPREQSIGAIIEITHHDAPAKVFNVDILNKNGNVVDNVMVGVDPDRKILIIYEVKKTLDLT